MTDDNAPIDRGFNVAVQHIASRLFPAGFDVGPDAPDTLAKLRAHVASTGRMKVWNGASDKTTFGDAETNYAFRAWHDWCHLKGNYSFTAEGEAEACRMQQSHVLELFGNTVDADRWCHMLDIEVNGQLRYSQEHGGGFPEDQRAFMAAELAKRGGA